MEIYVVNAFSKDNSGGNPAGIVMDGSLVRSNQERKRLAAHLGYSETVFCDTSDAADLRLSYFTPEGEVDLCGHATIAFFVLMSSINTTCRASYRVETKAGIINVSVSEDGLVMMTQCLPVFSSVVPLSELSECFSGLESDTRFEPVIVSTGLPDILLPVSSVDVLLGMEPHFEKISALSERYGCVGIHAFAMANDAVTAVCRNFAPLYGINEEAATGTSNGALASYLFSRGVRPEEYIFSQGHNLSSISEIIVKISSQGDKISAVTAGGRGYIVKIHQDQAFPF